jgi:malic enzyme
MKAIVMLFTNKTKTDSEEYIYPNIEKVRVTIEGVPNAVYSQGSQRKPQLQTLYVTCSSFPTALSRSQTDNLLE